VIFVAATNISITTGASDEMRTLLEHFFQAGFTAATADPKADLTSAWKKACPPLKSTALRHRILSASAANGEHLFMRTVNSRYFKCE
jgi:hypothetical protein